MYSTWVGDIWLTKGQGAIVEAACSYFMPISGFLQTEDHLLRMANSSKVSGSVSSNCLSWSSVSLESSYFDLNWIYKNDKVKLKRSISYNFPLDLPWLQSWCVFLFTLRNCCEKVLILLVFLIILQFFKILRSPPLEFVRVHWVLMKLRRQSSMFIPDRLSSSVVVIVLFVYPW